MMATRARYRSLMGRVGIGLVGGRRRRELVIGAAVATQACRHLRFVTRRTLRVASAAGEIRRHVLVDQESVPAAWSRRRSGRCMNDDRGAKASKRGEQGRQHSAHVWRQTEHSRDSESESDNSTEFRIICSVGRRGLT